jgi:hypothetical protein
MDRHGPIVFGMAECVPARESRSKNEQQTIFVITRRENLYFPILSLRAVARELDRVGRVSGRGSTGRRQENQSIFKPLFSRAARPIINI